VCKEVGGELLKPLTLLKTRTLKWLQHVCVVDGATLTHDADSVYTICVLVLFLYLSGATLTYEMWCRY
jgi:hypothetical protein